MYRLRGDVGMESALPQLAEIISAPLFRCLHALPFRSLGRGIGYLHPSAPDYRPWRTGMKLPHRRQFLNLAAGAAALPTASRIAMAQAYPTRSVTMVVPFAAGGTTDVVARVVSEHMSH